jgi:integrase
MKTRDWARAGRKAAALENPEAPQLKPVSEAIAAFEQHVQSLEPSTQRKYKNVLRHFGAYCEGAHLGDLADVAVDHLDAYRAKRELARTTAQKELETLRQFFAFCRERNWAKDNPAKKIRTAKNIRPEEVLPYEPGEITRIIAACDQVGRGSYERSRARAMVLLLRHTGLRVGDVAALARDRVQSGQILLHTQKTGGTVYLPIPDEIKAALDALPIPRGAGSVARYFFWNGVTSKRAVVGIAERTLAAVFKRSGVAKAHAHRFRHTLATDILAKGGTEQDVADILGISPAIVRKHYAKWSQARQQRITNLMKAVNFGTFTAHEEKPSVIQ